MTDPPAETELAWERAAERATGITLLALIEERDKLRKAADDRAQEKENSRLNEEPGSDHLRSRRRVRVGLALSRFARPIARRLKRR